MIRFHALRSLRLPTAALACWSAGALWAGSLQAQQPTPAGPAPPPAAPALTPAAPALTPAAPGLQPGGPAPALEPGAPATQPAAPGAQPAGPQGPLTDIFSGLGQDPFAEQAAEQAPPPITARNELETKYMPWLANYEDVAPQYTQAIQLMDQGQYQQAADLLGEVLQQARDYVPAMYEQARAYRALGELQRAMNLLRQASDFDRGESPIVLAELGSVALELQQYGEAQSYLQQAERLDPGNAQVLQLLGRSYYLQALGARGRSAQQLNEQAKDVLDRAVRRQPDLVDALFDRGRVLTQLGNMNADLLDAAIVDLEKTVELQPDHIQAWVNLALAYNMRGLREARIHRGDTAKVIEDLRKALDAYEHFAVLQRPIEEAAENEPPSTEEPPPDEFGLTGALVSRADARLTLGRELMTTDPQASTDQFRLAIQDAQEVIRRDRDSNEAIQAYFHMGAAYRLMGDHRRAVQALTDSLVLSDYSNPEAFLRRGISYYHLGQPGMAAVDFKRAQALQYQLVPDPRPNFWLGLVALEQNDLADATRQFTAAIEYSRNAYPMAALNRGICFLRLGNYERALEDFNTVLTLDGDNTLARQYRQLAQRRLAQRQ